MKRHHDWLAIALWIYLLIPGVALAQIESSVGAGGENRPDDVRRIQALLNAVSDVSGGPQEPLAEDGKSGPQTIAAIKRFQRMQLGFEDGRIDPQHKTELRLLRLNGKHVVLGTADTDRERQLAEFTSTFANIVVVANGKNMSVRPPYHINAGRRKNRAEANRQANPAVAQLISASVGKGSATVGKATPTQIRDVLQAAIDANLVSPLTPDGSREFLAKYGLSTDCSGLASRACNLLQPNNPLDVVNRANTAYLARLTAIASPAALEAGHMMVKGGSHVRLLTDVDMTAGGVEFTTLESTARSVFANGNGIAERRWRFPKPSEFSQLQEKKGKNFEPAAAADQAYIYTTK